MSEHCESCGQDITSDDMLDDEGFTGCCGARTSDGFELTWWAGDASSLEQGKRQVAQVRACCGFHADQAAERLHGDFTATSQV